MLLGTIVNGIDSLNFEALQTTICQSTALSLSILFPGAVVETNKQKLSGQPGDTSPEKRLKIFTIYRSKELDSSSDIREGNMKIDSLNILKKYCPKGTWVFLSAKFLPPGFQLWS